MKRLLLTLLLFISGILVYAIDFTVDGLVYTTTSDTTVAVTNGENCPGNCIIPSIVSNQEVSYTVTSIGDWAFYNLNLTSVTIPQSVTEIGYASFCWTDLTTVSIPNSVIAIGDYAFYTTPLISVVLSDSLISIGNNAFDDCFQLSSIVVPASVKSIGYFAFGNTSIVMDTSNPLFSSLDGVLYNKDQTKIIACPDKRTGNFVIPSTVDSIENFTFYDCWDLTSIYIPGSVTYIGAGAFTGCDSVMLDPLNTSFCILDNVLFTKAQSRLIYCPDTKTGDYAIPSTVDTIEHYAFCDCDLLTNITIPNSVTFIGSAAFEDCSQLSSIRIPGSVTYIGPCAFLWCSGLTTVYVCLPDPLPLNVDEFYDVDFETCVLYVPTGTVSLYKAADVWKKFVNVQEFNPTIINYQSTSTEMDVFYNPSTGMLTVHGISEPTTFTLHNIQGLQQLRGSIKEGEQRSMEGLPKGIYFIELNTGDQKVLKKIIHTH
jgi:hypothetical protein